jgi:hypothetical protein
MTGAFHEFQVPFSNIANNIQYTISIFFAWEKTSGNGRNLLDVFVCYQIFTDVFIESDAFLGLNIFLGFNYQLTT